MVKVVAAAALICATLGSTVAFVPSWTRQLTFKAAPTLVSHPGITSTCLSMASSSGAISMKPSINSSVEVVVEAAGKVTAECWKEGIANFCKEVSVPGFRKGDVVPEGILKNKYGEATLKSNALELLVERVVREAIAEKDIKAIGQAQLVSDPSTLLTNFNPGETVEVTFRVDVWPTVSYTTDIPADDTSNAPYRGLSVTVEEYPDDTEKMELAIQQLQDRYAILSDKEGDAAGELGDAFIIDMEGYIKNEDGSRGDKLPDIASGSDLELVLEEGRYMEGMVEGLLGAKAGESREVTVVLPSRQQLGQLVGKEAIFSVQVKEVKSRRLPERDDEFANRIRAGLTWEELFKEVTDTVNEDSKEKTKQNRDRAIDDKLIEMTEFEVPETLVVEQARQKFAVMMSEMKSTGDHSDEEIKEMITKENFDRYKEISRKSTEKQIKLGFIYEDIAERESLTVNPLDIEDQVDLLKAEHARSLMQASMQQGRGPPTPEQIAEDFDEKGTRTRIETTLRKAIVMDFIQNNGDVKYVPQGTLTKAGE